MARALFLGAGFSRWAANLPVANELFDFAIDVFGPRDAAKLQIVKELNGRWNSENPNGLAEQFIAHAMTLPAKLRQSVLWYITRRLSEPFIWSEFHAQRYRRHVLMIDEDRHHEIPGVVRAQNFLQRFCGQDLSGIVTTNYDMLPEYALGTRNFNYGDPGQALIGRGPYPVSVWKNPVRLTGSIRLAKIHGSVSWDLNGCYTDGRRGLTGQALIIAPTPEKEPPESLAHVWQLAEAILSPATEVIVFGFAFNPYDEAVLRLLRACSANTKTVQLINTCPQPDRAKAIWPGAEIVCQQPP
ncbi:MAG TPA: hypothetical protein DHU55_05130 [Blastocatellia bacterium]|nr:hypothetical protein [Blastocatellia bacterium]